MSAHPEPKPNRLADETSPYLLQHAGNPVDWHPWGPEALARARAEDKPILLSIGYSACHWCHVMAHESFEDPETAAVMNAHYVNVKVDREERPDLDRVYQTAHQLLARRAGGWPLTVFLAPGDLVPFFAGTYFPAEARHGLPAFRDLLEHLAKAFREQRPDVEKQNASLRDLLKRMEPPAGAPASTLESSPLTEARRVLEVEFDPRWGGFGHAPKFPHPATLEFLLRSPTESPPVRMALFTLSRMAEGGLQDQLGGGFYRYSVDDRWEIPHFEKMLYDNAQLLPLYALAAARTGDVYLRQVAINTAHWALREMRMAEGGFHAALDADSEGHEGRYYVWQRDVAHDLLTADEWRRAARYFGLDQEPNFEGRWHLKVAAGAARVAQELDEPVTTTLHYLGSARLKLHAMRERRVRPGLDDKVIAGWNGLMVRGLAIAGRVLAQPPFLDAATAAFDFVRGRMAVDGRLHATWKADRARHAALLDDHAFLLDAALALLEARWRPADLGWAVTLADALLARFEDGDAGGFWFTADDHEPLIHRPKVFADESLPAGAAAAARALLHLGWLLGEPRYLDAAERTVRAAWSALARYPHAHCTLLGVLDELLEPPEFVVLRGDAAALAEWAPKLARAGERRVFPIPADATDLPPELAAKAPQGRIVAYVCRGTTCRPPVTDLAALVAT